MEVTKPLLHQLQSGVRNSTTLDQFCVAIQQILSAENNLPPGGVSINLADLLATKALELIANELASGGSNGFSKQLFHVPTLLRRLGRSPPNKLQSIALARFINTRIAEGGPATPPLFFLMVLVEGISNSPDYSIAVAMDTISKLFPSRVVDQIDLTNLGRLLLNSRWLDGPSDLVNQGFGRIAAQANNLSEADRLSFIRKLLDFLCFERSAPEAWLHFVYRRFIRPAIEADCRSVEHVQQLLKFESWIYSAIGTKPDTMENFGRLCSEVQPILRSAGLFVRASLPAEAVRTTHVRPRVAFFLTTAGRLAHTLNLINFLSAASKMSNRPIDPYVYVNAPPDSALTQSLEQHCCAVEFLRPADDALDMIVKCREAAARDGIDIFVHVSTVLHMGFMAAIRIAPVHVWWSMKYHNFEIDGVDEYLAVGIFGQFAKYGSRTWRNACAALPGRFDPSKTQQAAKIRASLQRDSETIVLGCLGREAKLRNPEYVTALGRIRSACPNTVYLWTGRIECPEFASMLRDAGLDYWARYVGWVDTLLFAQVIDVMPDSFPMASGHTAFEAMAAGRPLVAMISPESIESSPAASIVPVFEGRIGSPKEQAEVKHIFRNDGDVNLFPFVRTVDEYVERAIRLVQDKRQREICGAAGRDFYLRFLQDTDRFAQSTCDHFIDIAKRVHPHAP